MADVLHTLMFLACLLGVLFGVVGLGFAFAGMPLLGLPDALALAIIGGAGAYVLSDPRH